MCVSEKRKEEYIQLKTEINNCIRFRNTLNTFTIPIVVGLLTFSYGTHTAGIELYYLCIFAQILMIPILHRIVIFRTEEMRLSAYMHVFLGEDFPSAFWEVEKYNNKCWLWHWEFFALSCVATVIICYKNIFDKQQISCPILFFSFFFTVIILVLTIMGNCYKKEKFIREWQNKRERAHVKTDTTL